MDIGLHSLTRLFPLLIASVLSLPAAFSQSETATVFFALSSELPERSLALRFPENSLAQDQGPTIGTPIQPSPQAEAETVVPRQLADSPKIDAPLEEPELNAPQTEVLTTTEIAESSQRVRTSLDGPLIPLTRPTPSLIAITLRDEFATVFPSRSSTRRPTTTQPSSSQEQTEALATYDELTKTGVKMNAYEYVILGQF